MRYSLSLVMFLISGGACWSGVERNPNTVMVKYSPPDLAGVFEQSGGLVERVNEPSAKASAPDKRQHVHKPTRVFPQPRYKGIQLDGRTTASSQSNMPAAANLFCKNEGFDEMLIFQVQTAPETIAIGDGTIFENEDGSNTAFRFITCQ